MKKTTELSLSMLMKKKNTPKRDKEKLKAEIEELQIEIVRIQQGIFNRKDRAIILFEGFDAAGKGGAIKKITEEIDPRGVRVHPIGPPSKSEKSKHYLYRFWRKLPAAGKIAIFDRSWYGRALVEKVEKLDSPERLKAAYDEINQFEKLLIDDGVVIIKFFLGITPDEQYRRFQDRMNDPYKHWKFTSEDLRARKKWDIYVDAVDEIFKKTSTKICPWHLIPADDKPFTQKEVLRIITRELAFSNDWMKKEAKKFKKKELKDELKKLQEV